MIEQDGDLLGYFADSDHYLDDAGRQVLGLFSAKYQEAEGYMGSRPAFQCREADVSNIQQGGQVALRKFSDQNSIALYAVQQFEPDGYGMTVLMLEEQ